MISELIQNLDKIEEHLPKSEAPLSLGELKEMMSVAFPSQEIFKKILNEQPILQDILKANTKLVKNLTMIKGGIKPNVIPDLCEAIMDFRLLPGQSTEMILDALKNVIMNLGYQIKSQPTGAPEEVFVYLEVLSETEASYWNDWRDSNVLKEFYSTVEKIYKKTPFYFFFPAGSDASYYRNNGYCEPTIIFGPGGARTAHAVNEYIEIQDYINSIKVYTLFACKFLENKIVD
jgi:acetylornithine deacetylase/succinyl-diaminopimelate desuccinylase-like protein